MTRRRWWWGVPCLWFIAGPSLAPATAQSSDEAREARFQRMLELPSIVADGVVRPRWMADGQTLWHPTGPRDSTVLMRVDATNGGATPLLDVGRVRKALRSALGHEPPYRGLPFRDITFDHEERWVGFTVEGRRWRLALSDYSLESVGPASAADRDRTTPRVIRSGAYGGDPDIRELPSPDGRWLATDKNHDIWLRSTVDGREQRLTNDGTAEWPWSIATNSEWTETPSTARFSPDGLRLAVVRANYEGVTALPLVHWLKPIEEIEWRPYVKAGGRLPTTELVIIDVLSGRRVTADIGPDTEHYLVPIGWRRNGSELLFYRMARNYKRLDVLATNPRTGSVRTVLTETSETFIKGIASTPGWGDLFTPLDDDEHFVWISERDGWDHLYLYRLDGTMVRRLTTGAWPVLQVVATDTDDGWVYFSGHAESRRYDTHLYRVGLDGRGFQRLTEGDGEHAVEFSPSRAVFVDVHSDLDRPPTTQLRAADGRLLRVLARATTDSLRALGWRAPEEVWVKASDGETDLRGVVITPPNFDPTRRYPVIEYIYGGPQTVTAPRGFVAQTFSQALAQLGFVVVTVDARGTTERGKAFQDVVYRQFGTHEIPDHVAALRAIGSSRPYMDLDRVGIFGGSWGGYMTIRAMVLAPEFYKAGVSIYPVADLIDHWNLIESYMDLPTSNPKGYAAASSLNRVGNIRGRLLLIHGTSDVNATVSSTMKMVDALTRAGKPYDLILMPEETHAMTPTASAYRTAALKRFFIEHLEP